MGKTYTVSKFHQGLHRNLTIRLNGEVIAYYNYPHLDFESNLGLDEQNGREAFYNLPEGEVNEDQVKLYFNHFNLNDYVVKLYCWHPLYDIGEKHNYSSHKDFAELNGLMGSVYISDHGQIALSCQPFNDHCGSSFIGVWHIPAKDLTEFPDEESVRQYVTTFLDEYTNYLNGYCDFAKRIAR